jgi:hypothetical protein
MIQYRFYASYVIFLIAFTYALQPFVAATRQSNALATPIRPWPSPSLPHIALVQTSITLCRSTTTSSHQPPERGNTVCSRRNAVYTKQLSKTPFPSQTQPHRLKFDKGRSPRGVQSSLINALDPAQKWRAMQSSEVRQCNPSPTSQLDKLYFWSQLL